MKIREKIKCYCGFHNWEYSTWKSEEYSIVTKSDMSHINELLERQYHYPSRFCQCCHKKQKRVITDFGRTILWENTDRLTINEIRQKKLKKILN